MTVRRIGTARASAPWRKEEEEMSVCIELVSLKAATLPVPASKPFASMSVHVTSAVAYSISWRSRMRHEMEYAPGSVGAQRAVDGRHAPPAPELSAESSLACRQGDSVKDVCAVVAADVGVGDGGAAVACAVAVLGDVVGDFGGAVTDFEGRVAFRCTVCGRSLEGEDGARGIAHGV
jgi:hypothetical protein